MIFLLLLICGVEFTIVSGNCGPCGPMPKHYEELGCVGKYIDGPCCPERFECPDLTKLDTNVCHFKGRAYEKGERVTKMDSPICIEECVCGESDGGDKQFICTKQECADMSRQPEHDCVYKHSLDHCCSVKRICGEKAKRLPQCHFRGEIHSYGQKFTSHSPYAACHICLCDEYFDNSTSIEANKNCNKVDCGLELTDMNRFKNGCVPIYIKDTKCCPIDFRCPNDNDKILPAEYLPEITSIQPNTFCKFGNLTLQRFQSITTDDKCTECTCRYPPMIECIKEKDC